jgi:hypothetical protein
LAKRFLNFKKNKAKLTNKEKIFDTFSKKASLTKEKKNK